MVWLSVVGHVKSAMLPRRDQQPDRTGPIEGPPQDPAELARAAKRKARRLVVATASHSYSQKNLPQPITI